MHQQESLAVKRGFDLGTEGMRAECHCYVTATNRLNQESGSTLFLILITAVSWSTQLSSYGLGKFWADFLVARIDSRLTGGMCGEQRFISNYVHKVKRTSCHSKVLYCDTFACKHKQLKLECNLFSVSKVVIAA